MLSSTSLCAPHCHFVQSLARNCGQPASRARNSNLRRQRRPSEPVRLHATAPLLHCSTAPPLPRFCTPETAADCCAHGPHRSLHDGARPRPVRVVRGPRRARRQRELGSGPSSSRCRAQNHRSVPAALAVQSTEVIRCAVNGFIRRAKPGSPALNPALVDREAG